LSFPPGRLTFLLTKEGLRVRRPLSSQMFISGEPIFLSFYLGRPPHKIVSACFLPLFSFFPSMRRIIALFVFLPFLFPRSILLGVFFFLPSFSILFFGCALLFFLPFPFLPVQHGLCDSSWSFFLYLSLFFFLEIKALRSSFFPNLVTFRNLHDGLSNLPLTTKDAFRSWTFPEYIFFSFFFRPAFSTKARRSFLEFPLA